MKLEMSSSGLEVSFGSVTSCVLSEAGDLAIYSCDLSFCAVCSWYFFLGCDLGFSCDLGVFYDLELCVTIFRFPPMSPLAFFCKADLLTPESGVFCVFGVNIISVSITWHRAAISVETGTCTCLEAPHFVMTKAGFARSVLALLESSILGLLLLSPSVGGMELY